MTEMVVHQGEISPAPLAKRPAMLMPQVTVAELNARVAFIHTLVTEVMVAGIDYAQPAGTGDKKILKKPGAEKLCTAFTLTPIFKTAEQLLDWDGSRHGGEPLFYYRIICELWHGEALIASSMGSCNSREKKYRYHTAERTCPTCGKQTIIKGRIEYGGGWLCFYKKGGCGAKFEDTDPAIIEQETGQVLNPDPADLENTILKMAENRAYVGTTLIAANVSDIFTQDLDYLEITIDSPSKPMPQEAPHPQSQKPIPQISETISPLQLRRLHSLGKEIYGDGWDEKRPELVKSVSRGETVSSKELTPKEAATLIEGLEKKAIEKRATQEVASYEVPAEATEPASPEHDPCEACGVALATTSHDNRNLCQTCAERAAITAELKAKRKPKTAA